MTSKQKKQETTIEEVKTEKKSKAAAAAAKEEDDSASSEDQKAQQELAAALQKMQKDANDAETEYNAEYTKYQKLDSEACAQLKTAHEKLRAFELLQKKFMLAAIDVQNQTINSMKSSSGTQAGASK
jgi:hypothetical protein